jgi:hypothetical protein
LIVIEAQQRVALQAFEDGPVEEACPPLRALLSILAHGAYEGKEARHPDIRRLFTLESLRTSEWYRKRLTAKQHVDERLWHRHIAARGAWLAENAAAGSVFTAQVRQRRDSAAGQLDRITAPGYLKGLHGTLGVQPSLYP